MPFVVDLVKNTLSDEAKKRSEKEDLKQAKFLEKIEIKNLKELKKTKHIKEPKISKTEQKYNDIMNNPKISNKAKAILKRGTNNGTKLNIKDLEGFEKAELFLIDSDSEEEETIKAKKNRSHSPTSITHDFEKPKKEKKTYKESNIMKARSDLKKKGDKYEVETEMNVRKGLDKKVKSALKKSVISQLDKSISGSGVEKIVLDYSSSSEDEKPKKRGRPKKIIGKGGTDKTLYNMRKHSERRILEELHKPNLTEEELEKSVKKNSQKNANISGRILERLAKEDTDDLLDKDKKKNDELFRKLEDDYQHNMLIEKKKNKKLFNKLEDDYQYNTYMGKGVYEDDSSSDEEDIKEYGKILKHLIGHIKDPKEKIDKNDFKQAIELIKKIKSKKK